MSKRLFGQMILCQRRRFIIAAAVGVAAPLHAAYASTVNFYDVQIISTHITETSSSPLSTSGSGTVPAYGFSYSYSVLAGPGLLGNSNSVTVAPGQSSADGVISSNTNFTMSDIVLTGPSGSTFAQYSFNFDVTGSFTLSSSGYYATATGVVGLDDANGSLGSMSANTQGVSGANGVFQGQTPSAGSSFDFAASTEKHTVENGSSVTLMLNLSTSATVTAYYGYSGSATTDFVDPLSFPTNGPVISFFDLTGAPISGWTANSEDGCIVNNRFVCGAASSDVPELSTWAMMLVGFAGLGYATWRRATRAKAVAAEGCATNSNHAPAGCTAQPKRGKCRQCASRRWRSEASLFARGVTGANSRAEGESRV